jgi:hypothetical protein
VGYDEGPRVYGLAYPYPSYGYNPTTRSSADTMATSHSILWVSSIPEDGDRWAAFGIFATRGGAIGAEEDGVNLVICKPHVDAVIQIRRHRGDQCVPPRTERKRFMRWRGSHYRETADRRNRLIAPIRAGSPERRTLPGLHRDRDEWTEVL